MTDLHLNKLRTAFGLDDDASVEIAAEIPVPESEVGRGEAARSLDGPGAASYEELSADLLKAGDLEELVRIDKPIANARIYTSPYPGLMGVTPMEVVEPRGGTWWVHEEVAFCDARSESALALVSDPEGVKGLELRPDLVRVLRVHRSASAELRTLAGREPPPAFEADAPDVDDLLCGLAAEPWLVAEAKEMAATGEPLLRLAAAGMVARLFSPRDRAQRERLLAEMLEAGRHPVVDAVRSYASSLDANALESLDHLVAALADGLHDRLDELRELVVEDLPDAPDAALGLLLSRDEIESVLYVLRAAGGGENAAEAVAAFDREAVAAAMDIDLARPPRHDRLLAVSRCDPTCWWGLE